MKIKVYTLLTLGREEVRRILPGAIVTGPVERGDVAGDMAAGRRVIVIIDGKFGQVPPVNPGEIMDALRAGIRVYGASSMGALRAAELHPFGMIGHGAIYEMIRKSLAFRDDYLGQIIASSARSDLSLPYIDFYFNARRLLERGALPRATVERMEQLFGDIHFSARSPASLEQLFRKHFAGEPRVLEVLSRARFTGRSQKRIDALGVLRRARADLARIARLNRALARRLETGSRGAFAR